MGNLIGAFIDASVAAVSGGFQSGSPRTKPAALEVPESLQTELDAWRQRSMQRRVAAVLSAHS